MSNNSVPNRIRPIWTPEDAREAAEEAKRHEPVRLRDWAWAPALITLGILGVGLLTGCTRTAAEGTPVVASEPTTSTAAAPTLSEQEITDRAFIATLDGQGITYTSREDAIAGGRAVCELVAEADGNLYTTALAVAAGTELSLENAAYLVGASTAAYCPEYLDDMEGGN
ncbi:hypothetical protein I5J47_gp38 [Mycobacterium phage Arib1]|uniref:DUF732 domain-containing protein n=3 Tax=Fishburnevirus TaxID=1983734 RepID=A0A514A5Q6_9CAUD|nr:hypothetical protein PBI_DONOVAN_38 [Mycobacterium phage Donovan]YP_009964922.1 hypothetical protein I5J47_gp38 [Mycobacterium phage Arib1]QDH48606.1 hypothetical protein SEA_TECHAGE_38 [Mycobacterium phage Techage]QDH84994.1 hypothetical protein SEA_HUHILLTOP_38 [Mycobacterium phage HUHilltop]UVT30942.1 hypothetical protein SEA_LANGERAK_38 [Mycobacterium phage Langerak]WDW19666.1 hypothetical protein [Mycobacterium phage LOCV1]WDW19735.1 hypothetical protein [Mycobacterium phage LOCV2]WD